MRTWRPEPLDDGASSSTERGRGTLEINFNLAQNLNFVKQN